jgi:hypothetical protein
MDERLNMCGWKRLYVTILSLFLTVSVAHAQLYPRVFLIDGKTLYTVRTSFKNGEKTYQPALAELFKDAGKSLRVAPVSVMEKQQLPPSGDKHDYLSIAPYWWPDSTKPDGLPYIRRDGEINPERYTVGDRERLGTMIKSVWNLALAYYISGEDQFADHASKFLRTWFLNPETRMSPHLKFAQFIRGENDGRGAGIIDTYGFRQVLDAVGLLEGARGWTQSDLEGMKRWFDEYLIWLMESDNGKDEAKTKNNHGSTYTVQVSCIALFVGKDSVAEELIKMTKRRIAAQIKPDGSQPEELVRTKSWNYSMLNLEALVQLAWLGDRFGENIWTYTTHDGRSIKKAIQYLLPSALGMKKWRHKQIVSMETERLVSVLQILSVKLDDEAYAQMMKDLKKVNWKTQQSLILYPQFQK